MVYSGAVSKRLSLTVYEPESEILDRIAKKERRTLASVIRQALEEYCARRWRRVK